MAPTDPMAEIRASFFVECEELLEAMQDGLQLMDDGEDDSETIHIVFRAVHSIKGGAGAFGLEALVRFAHKYETVLDGVRSGRLNVDSELLKLFFRASDHLSDLVRACRDDTDIPTAQGEHLAGELDACIAAEPSLAEPEPEIDFNPVGLKLDFDFGPDLSEETTSEGVKTYLITFTPDNEMYENGNDAYPVLHALSELGDCKVTCNTSKLPSFDQLVPETSYLSWSIELSTAVDEAEINSTFEFVEGLCSFSVTDSDGETPEPVSIPSLEPLPPLDKAPTAPPEPISASAQPAQKPEEQRAPVAAKSVVRVDLDRIERLVNLVGELVINQAMLAQSLLSAGLSPHSDAMNGLEEFQRLTRDIQDSVMMIRAQPVKSLFQRMSRIVRESSAAVGKNVRLHTDGETTEVDKTVIERLADPLTHMIRNAVDHGLESTADRVAAGKPEEGVVRLSAAHRSGRVIIEVADDGAGIDRARVFKIACEKGLVAADAALSDTEIDNLLFLPGFSTASTVSDLSGRGVGMDVVRTAIQALGGRISIASNEGSGTTFTISLPLTLAVLDGMVVEVAGETLVLPLNMVAETMTLTETSLETLQPGLNIVRVRDGFVPLFDLGHLLGYRDRKDTYVDSVALLISHEDGRAGALIVDEIQDQRQVVIKGLDDTYYRAPGIAAATILGDGQIALILDPSDIVAQASDLSRPAPAPMKMEA
ncbi:chemotaxis protein CheA [uncultured Tateyamaria sp.]|uniref:chemotaxis protein CheA n=1 Tax=uncultured Tateyamaria sp. TaxID=455651 RepID=UPI00262FC6FD|nr:chemotaxis protein CheA [uncultured Tateyamaria sp.]